MRVSTYRLHIPKNSIFKYENTLLYLQNKFIYKLSSELCSVVLLVIQFS